MHRSRKLVGFKETEKALKTLNRWPNYQAPIFILGLIPLAHIYAV